MPKKNKIVVTGWAGFVGTNLIKLLLKKNGKKINIINNKKREIYFCRLSGILNSIIGKKAWYRPSIDWFFKFKNINKTDAKKK